MTDLHSDVDNVLASLIHLGKRSRNAQTINELGFIAVNETHGLLPYRQAALWLSTSTHSGKVVALSGVTSIEANAPYVAWLNELVASITFKDDAVSQLVDPSQLPPLIVEQWGEWFPSEVVALRLNPVAGFKGGVLLLARDIPWQTSDFDLLDEWAALLSQAYAVLTPLSLRSRYADWRARALKGQAEENDSHPNLIARLRYWFVNRSMTQMVLLSIAVVCVIPVKLTVLAPAELVPLNPAIIRSPMDGVIERILVTPNQSVDKGDSLIEFDRVSLSSRLEVAKRSLATAKAEYRQSAQQALIDADTKNQLALTQGKVQEKQTELAFLRELHERGMVASPKSGVAIYDDPTVWIGRPVVTGERIMAIAEPNNSEVEAWLSISDAVPFKPGAKVTVYLNADPLSPVEAELRYVSHEPTDRPEGYYAYRVRAQITEAEFANKRVGLKGTAKISGDRVMLVYWIFRKPLASLRAWIGI